MSNEPGVLRHIGGGAMRVVVLGSFVTALVALAACEPIPPSIRGTVTAFNVACDGKPPPSAGAPEAISGATIVPRCPGSADAPFSVTSDARGVFFEALKSPVPLTCEVVVQKDGYEPRVYAVKDVCARQTGKGDQCDALTISARLTLRPAKEAQ